MMLRKPNLDDELMLRDYIQEHYDNGEYSISASNNMPIMDYKDWLNKLEEAESGNNMVWGISETYILVDNNKVMGMLNIRYTLNNEMANVYGHIGYGVRPTERRKGIATYILKEALIKCKNRGMSEVMLGCYENNIGSEKTIINNGGILYRKSKMKDRNANYYKIML